MTISIAIPQTVPGTDRPWKWPDHLVPGEKSACYDCELPCEDFNGDLSLPHDAWEAINPTNYRGAGLLCANCIMRRLRAVGLTGIEAKLWP